MAVAERSLTRPLKVLVPLIKDDLEMARLAGVPYYRAAGEKLIEAREQVAHGDWKAWVDRNFHLSYSTANDYMNLAQKSGRLNFSTLSEATRPQRESHQPTWHAPVNSIASKVKLEALAQARLASEDEKKLLRQLSHQLIDIGYKVLAAKLHPDKPGGSTESMRRLNEVRRALKEAL